MVGHLDRLKVPAWVSYRWTEADYRESERVSYDRPSWKQDQELPTYARAGTDYDHAESGMQRANALSDGSFTLFLDRTGTDIDYRIVSIHVDIKRLWEWGGFGLFPAKETFDADVEINVDAIWLDAKQKMHTENIAGLSVTLRGIKLPVDAGESSEVPSSHFSALSSQWFPRIPRSTLDDAPLPSGSGTYVLRVKVREFDDFGDRINQIKPLLESQRTNIPEYVNIVLSRDEAQPPRTGPTPGLTPGPTPGPTPDTATNPVDEPE